MKLNKKVEAEVLKAYYACWDSYLEGDIATHGTYLSPHFKIIGTSISEDFQNKKTWLAYCRKTVKQYAGALRLKNRKIKLLPFGEQVMIVENSDIYIKIETKWNYYSAIRITGLFQKEKTGWKYIHQHSSLPDPKANEGEVIATEQIKKENLQLRDAVKRRTIELEEKNRELEIESSLERIRTVAMSMSRPDDILNICKVMFEALEGLGIEKIRNVIINFWDDKQQILLDYDYSDFTGAHFARLPYNSHPSFVTFQKKMRKANDFFVKIEVKNEKLKSWRARRKIDGEYDDPRLKKISALYYYFYSIGIGALGISTFSPISKPHLEILKRFRNVFQLAYKRYLDIQTAETQAREAQIETALERVRSKTMAMHASNDLLEVTQTLADQLKNLGFKDDTVSFITDSDDKGYNMWLASNDDKFLSKIYVPRINDKSTHLFREAVAKGLTSYSYVLNKKEKDIFFRNFFENTILKDHKGDGRQAVFGAPGMASSVVIMDKIVLFVGNFSATPYTEENSAVIRRFAAVFQQSYTRFLDLQKAEAQAREAQIETALERVRARSMGMQKSEELQDVVAVLYKQFEELDFGLYQVLVSIFDLKQDRIEWWSRSFINVDLPQRNLIPIVDHPFPNRIMARWKAGDEYYEHIFEGEIKNSWEDYLFTKTDLKKFPREVKDAMRNIDKVYLSDVFMKYGSLQAAGAAPLPPGKVEILKRFTKVLDLAYTRMIDLQNAEEQAKESKIQLALERVRARTMAMQKSEELAETASLLFEQLKQLGESPERAFIGIVNNEEGVLETWATQHGGKLMSQLLKLSLDEPIVIKKAFQAWKEQKRSVIIDLKGKDLEGYFQYLVGQGAPVSREIFGDRRVENLAFFSRGLIGVITPEPVTAEALHLYERFASVFDLTYTRFLDLKKAEAQARESQVQLALERVRARTMAMQRSDELSDATYVLFQQFKELGQTAAQISIGIFKIEEGYIELSATLHGNQLLQTYHLPIDEKWVTQKIVKAWMEKKKSLVIVLEGEELRNYNAWRNTILERPVDFLEDKWVVNVVFFTRGMLSFSSSEGISAETVELLERFAAVFDQTYRRFLDLQKAEAQGREAQIEAALERVRSRAMAMQGSNELGALIGTVFAELTKLHLVLTRSVLWIIDAKTKDITWWMANSEDPDNPIRCQIPYHEHPPNLAFLEQWKLRTLRFEYVLAGQVKKDWDEFLFSKSELKDLPSVVKQGMRAPEQVLLSASFNNFGAMNVASLEPLSEEHFDILLRFARVFDLTYTRFNDLKQAEAQTREAQVELALERVRARTMAMHRSEELAETAVVMFKQLIGLGIEPNRLYIAIINDKSGNLEFWITDEDGDKMSSRYMVNINRNISIRKMYEGWVEKKQVLTIDMQGDELEAWLNYWKEEFQVPFKPGAALKRRVQSIAYFSKGFIAIASPDDQPGSTINLLERFAAVFNLTYTRFNDLQQAEAQANEAQIEAGLERVRAKTMAMHSSEDVSTATATMFTELEKLGIQNLRGGITIIKPDQTQEVWAISNLPEGRAIRSIGVFDMNLHPFWQDTLKKRNNNEDFGYYWLAGKDKQNYIDILNSTPNYLKQPIKEFPDVHAQTYFFGEGAIWTNSLALHTEEQKHTMKRFASVFSLTFRRYLDLQKAEAQAKEAQIEAGLERVRAMAMAMHNSQDLADTIGVFYRELKLFSITPRRCGVGLLDHDDRIGELFTWNTTEEGESLELVGRLKMEGHPVLEGVYDHWISQTEYHPVLRGNEIKEYYQVVRPQMAFPDYSHDDVQYGYFFFFKEGGVYAWTEKEMNENELQIYRRFTSVLSLTYKRYKDLKHAEESARETFRQASLDRVRAEIASMRTVEDLQRITPVIWNELTILNIPFIRCGIFIMDEVQKLIHTFLSTPDGKAIASFHLPYDTPGNIGTVVDSWRGKKQYIDHWDEKEFYKFAEILVQQGTIESAENYLKTIPQGGFYLHFLPFLQGMLYVGNTGQLNEEQIELIQHLAQAFSTAYARYEDFNRLEAAKHQVERTLSDLKQAQQQLVQSEKMASLGELTAGIAHEIQNPLNFVNNFSDVSNELLIEMEQELEKGNYVEALALAEDVKQNLEKIHHHGKRADGIVKGMLQHSRTSSGQKELIDINLLADEYLRLAYHGLRAKDKSFNAKFETRLDESIDKIYIIPQDIGRVILNLINNAFYAVSEKKRENTNGYEPTVTVTTAKSGSKVEVRVIDNGGGIPKRVLDKIFQPFFTTKPTGQGTGLGLSLSYDIITKGHGGNLSVETKDGEGTTFIIQLPLS
jgi:signal transduction histidine kinase